MSILAIALVLGWGIGSRLFADSPSVQIQSGSSTWDVALTWVSPGVWDATDPGKTYTASSGASIQVNELTLDNDPNIHYAIGVTNPDGATSPTPYIMTFVMPVSLAAGPVAVSSSVSGSATDGAEDGVEISPISGAIQQSFIGSTDAGVDLLGSSLIFSSSPESQPFGPDTASSSLTLASPATSIKVKTSFTLSGNDSATISGRFNVAVPEPSTYALLLAGLIGLLAVSFRRRNGSLK